MSDEDGRPHDEAHGDAAGGAPGGLSSAPPERGGGARHAPASTDPDEPRPQAADGAPDGWLDGPPLAPEPGGDQSAEESLDEALGHLERMLERRDDADSPPPGRSESGAERRTDQQYEIPLLDEVVLPSADGGRGAGRDAAHGLDDVAGEIPHEESDALSRLVAERLASEIEIIVNDRIERAIGEALADAQTRIREHLAIVLPEIVDELRQVRRDGGRNPHGS